MHSAQVHRDELVAKLKAALTQEALLAKWFEENNLERMHANFRAGTLIFEFDGIGLYARPSKTMHRDHEFQPYREVDGVAYWLTNSGSDLGNRVAWFTDITSDQNGYQSTFDYLLNTTSQKFIESLDRRIRFAEFRDQCRQVYPRAKQFKEASPYGKYLSGEILSIGAEFAAQRQPYGVVIVYETADLPNDIQVGDILSIKGNGWRGGYEITHRKPAAHEEPTEQDNPLTPSL